MTACPIHVFPILRGTAGSLPGRRAHDADFGGISLGTQMGRTTTFFASQQRLGWATWRRAGDLRYSGRVVAPAARHAAALEIVGDQVPFPGGFNSKKPTSRNPVGHLGLPVTLPAGCKRDCALSAQFRLITNVRVPGRRDPPRWSGNKFAHIPLEEMAFPLQHPPHVIPYEEADDVYVREVFFSGCPNTRKTVRTVSATSCAGLMRRPFPSLCDCGCGVCGVKRMVMWRRTGCDG